MMRNLLNLPPWNPRPFFQVAPGWKPFLFCNDMTPHWEGVTLEDRQANICGVNYFVMPLPSAGREYSAHFDPDSPFFQSFYGVYVIPPHDGRRIPIDAELVRELGYRDQIAWLRFMGAPGPFAPLTSQKGAIALPDSRETEALRVYCEYALPVDLGARNPENVPPLFRSPRSGRGAPPPSLVDDFQEALVPVYCTLRYAGEYLLIQFQLHSIFLDRKGTRIDTIERFPELERGFAAMNASMTLLDNGSGFSSPALIQRTEPAQGGAGS